ncbi:MAG: hypothetical protein GX587_05520 [Bacteroidales bacterium]|nr:hypothetical protein [Bacteroidales bacterium]
MFEEVNKVLSEWDPIGVGTPLSLSEYRQYVPKIISKMTNRMELEQSLIEVLENMGLSYNPNDCSHRKDIQEVIRKILSIRE